MDEPAFVPAAARELTGERFAWAEFLLAREGYPTTASMAGLAPAERDALIEALINQDRNERFDELSCLPDAVLNQRFEAEKRELEREVAEYLVKLSSSEMEVYGRAASWTIAEALALAHGFKPQTGLVPWLERNRTLSPDLSEMFEALRLIRVGQATGGLSDPIEPYSFLQWAKRTKYKQDQLKIPPWLVSVINETATRARVRDVRQQRLIETDELLELLSVSRGTILNWEREGMIPKPVWIGRSKRWLASEIEDWMADLPRERPPGAG